jgi:DNA-binding transcriptional ArsR family regulator
MTVSFWVNYCLTARTPARYIVSPMANHQASLSVIFSALADPTRRRILERLARTTELRVTALAKPFRMSLPSVSKHLRVLENAQLIRRERRGRLHLIRANAGALRNAETWIAQCAAGWQFSLNKLDQLVEKDRKKKTP